jgi:hypothetical protein
VRPGLEGSDALRLGPAPFPWPPGPGDRVGWREVEDRRPDLVPAERVIRRVAHGLPDRVDGSAPWWVDRVRALGNAVVPAQATNAVRELTERVLEV